MIYDNYLFKSKEEVIGLLNTGSSENIITALIGAVNGIDDWFWLEGLCLNYLHHTDFWVSKTAINSLGDIARIHKVLNVEKVLSELKLIKENKLSGLIRETVLDIELFVK
ncbi:hypothetical protein [Flavobacterium cerinum]|uniref:HEAT repeat domain-containing protein n=1 Tax=Flavobacterium cerinum TaxID=2502784 RepID=A0A444HFK5_9FLAO|nr:hypothetical protein [Flavobacterium cerinum]RWX03663.1 hypothetical protein EPI11_01685 [Flavobacterium cerinum]